MVAPDDCTRCGACCFSESPRHVRVTGDDHERLGEEAEAWVAWIGNEAYLRLAPFEGTAIRACAALRAEDGRFLCRIYERRPTVCRTLERASGACRGERDTKGARVLEASALIRAKTPM